MQMETLREVLMRLHCLTEDEADERISRIREMLAKHPDDPSSVLIEEFGTNIDYLLKILDPAEKYVQS